MIHPKDLGQPLPLHLQGVLTTEQERYDFFAAMEAQEAQMYAAKRINEYPPITDYLDGVVKATKRRSTRTSLHVKQSKTNTRSRSNP